MSKIETKRTSPQYEAYIQSRIDRLPTYDEWMLKRASKLNDERISASLEKLAARQLRDLKAKEAKLLADRAAFQANLDSRT